MWKGPSTVDSVASDALRWLMASTSMVTPSTSDSRMNSWRWSSHMRPVAARNSTARSHSSKVGSTSRTNSCRCLTRLPRSSRSRGSGVAAKLATTAPVAVSSVKSMPAPLRSLRLGRDQ